MSSAVARPMRSSSNTLTSSKTFLLSLVMQVSCGASCARSGATRRGGRRYEDKTSDLFDGAGLEAAGQVDTELLGGAVHVVVGVPHLHGVAVGREDLDVQAERLELLEQHLERLRDARLGDVLALDDRLVHLDAAEDVVGLDRQQLLQRVRRAVGLHRPALHLTEALATELRLTTQRLLGDHA